MVEDKNRHGLSPSMKIGTKKKGRDGLPRLLRTPLSPF
jgi:hypothetical protein